MEMSELGIKICGITTPEDAVAARELGADYLGMILSQGFARSILPDEAVDIGLVAGAPGRTRLSKKSSVDWALAAKAVMARPRLIDTLNEAIFFVTELGGGCITDSPTRASPTIKDPNLLSPTYHLDWTVGKGQYRSGPHRYGRTRLVPRAIRGADLEIHRRRRNRG